MSTAIIAEARLRNTRSLRAAFGVVGCIAVVAGSLTLATSAIAEPMPTETVLQVPGFADFIAVDGDAVWVTNKGRVERWSLRGKQAEVPIAHPCGAMVIAAGALWVADCAGGALDRVDLATAKVVATIPTGIANPKGELNVVAGDGSIWVTSAAGGGVTEGAIARVDPAQNRVIASVSVAPDSFYLAYGLGSLWAVSGTGNLIQKIDPATNRVVKTTSLGKEPGFLAAGEGAVWVQEQGDGTVARVDPTTGEVSGRVKVDATLKYGDIDTGAGKVWLRTTAGQTFVAIDPATLAIVARTGADAGSGGLRYAPGGVWTTAHDRHTLTWWATASSVGQ